jgi:hypothetical protein
MRCCARLLRTALLPRVPRKGAGAAYTDDVHQLRLIATRAPVHRCLCRGDNITRKHRTHLAAALRTSQTHAARPCIPQERARSLLPQKPRAPRR